MDERNETTSVRIRLEDISVAEATIGIKTLRNDVLNADRRVKAEIVQENPAHQDFGSTLILVLGAPAAISVAKGIAAWLAREGGKATLIMDIGEGKTIKFKGNSADATAIARALASTAK
jgi:hypothetical protein